MTRDTHQNQLTDGRDRMSSVHFDFLLLGFLFIGTCSTTFLLCNERARSLYISERI